MMTDLEIIRKLIDKDEDVTADFFFRRCRPLFISIIRNVFSYDVDYDEFVNEFYLYLMENDAYRLRQFEGRSTVYQWMKIVAIRYFIARRDNLIDGDSGDCLMDVAARKEIVDVENPLTSRIDVRCLLDQMPNRRYAYVIRRLVLDDAEPCKVASELGTNVDNLYNIKKRAITAFTQVVLNEVGRYETAVGR